MGALAAIIILFVAFMFAQSRPNFLKGTHASKFRIDLIIIVILFLILIGLVGGK